MKNVVQLLKLCMLCLLFGFATAYATETGATGSTTYRVAKGDTLTTIAKKFTGVTWYTLAQTNNIANANLIYPNTILTISQTNVANVGEMKTRHNVSYVDVKVLSQQRTTEKLSVKSTVACDAQRGLDQLKFPATVQSMFESARLMQNGKAIFAPNPIYSVISDNNLYVFEISRHCVYTKTVQRVPQTAHESVEEHSDRSMTRISNEISLTLPPEITPGHVTVPIHDISSVLVALINNEHDLEMKRVSIRRFLQKYVGPPYDIDHMQKILLEQMHPSTR